MSEDGYWQNSPRRRFGRRRLLALGGTAAVGVALAGTLGCADDKQAPPEESGSPEATAAQPKRGGILRLARDAPISTLDPYVGPAGLSLNVVGAVYSRLFALASGPGVPAITSKTVPDLVKSFEVTPDGLTYLFRLRENAKFHPPINRPVTADDVVFSFDGYMGKLPGSTPAAQSAQFKVVKSLDKVDSLTVRFNLTEPVGTFLSLFVTVHGPLILPKETGTAFNPSRQAVGSGPWIFEDYTEGVVAKFRRNPEWHLGPGKPYIERIEWYVIPDGATRISQFLGGNVDEVIVPTTDVKRVLDGVRGAQLDIKPAGSTPLSVMAFSWDQMHAGAPFADVRVRHAISMGIDRDAIAEAAYSFKELEGLGVKINRGWNNFVPVAFQDFWLDPQGSKMDQKYGRLFKYDPEAAKRLLAEAGHPNGFSVKLNYVPTFAADYRTAAELFAQYMARIGIRVTLAPADLAADYPKIRRGDFDGMAFILVGGSVAAEDYLAQMYIKGSGRNSGKIDDPALESQLKAMLANPDEDSRRKKVLELQNAYLPEKMYYVPMQVGAGPTITAYQPHIKGAMEYNSTYPAGTISAGSDNVPSWWIDEG